MITKKSIISNKQLFLLASIFILSAVFLQTASAIAAPHVTTSLFYDSTNSTTLQITDGQGFGVIVSADSVLEQYMNISVDLKNAATNATITNLLSAFTTNDTYFDYMVLGSYVYPGPGNYTILSHVTTGTGDTTNSILHLEVLPKITPIPEFGVIAGIITLVSAVGIFVFIRRR